MLQEKTAGFVPQAIYTAAPPAGEAASPGGVISYKRGADHEYYVPDLQGHNRQRTTAAGVVDDVDICDAWGNEIYTTGALHQFLKAFGQHGYWRDTANRLYVEQRPGKPSRHRPTRSIAPGGQGCSCRRTQRRGSTSTTRSASRSVH